MLFSLSMQTFLILFAPLRKGTANKLIIMLLWSVYLLADWAANFAVGIISDSQGNPPDASTPSDNSDLLAFWPPFLLLHLGGPDTITAFALEDNELWLRHLLGLIFQAVAAVYVFLQSLPNKLAIPIILMFVSGTIKYLERTRALYLASLDRFRDSMLKEPDPGPNYAKLMDEYASKKEAKHPAKIITIEEPVNSYVKTEASRVGELNNLEVVQQAYRYFEIFKGLIVDLIFSFHERDESRDFFGKLHQEDALRVIVILSDYMLYLLVMQPSMMSAVAGIGKIRFRDTCAEANRLFKRKSLKGNQEKEACTKILDVNTYVKPVTVKGDRSKSVLFDASMLAKQLKKLDDKWELLSKIWVELLSYAACNCSARTHAQQVSKGGELITFVWLLMAHFGLGDQFQINKGQGRAKLIVTK
ncbi:hypothetical protein QYF36_024095 [Acer negundo]|nr:hypothetical protein QYF36_024095 [Acer negundo]